MIPRVLLLDGDDSYSHNLVGLVAEAFGHAHDQVDERVAVLRSRDYDDDLVQLLPHFGVLVLGPGPGSPSSAEATHPARVFTRLLAEHPVDPPMPTLGVCLGHQALAASAGLAIVAAPDVAHGVVHRVDAAVDSYGRGWGMWRGSERGCDAVTYNSLTVDATRLRGPRAASTLPVFATAWMGAAVMGLQHRTLPFHSVQFHPESVCSKGGATLVRAFFALAAQSQRLKAQPSLCDPLPSHLLALSKIRRPCAPEPPLSSPMRFQLRVKPLEHVQASPQTLFEALIKDTSVLGDLWLDSASANTVLCGKKDHDAAGDVHLASSDIRGRYSFLSSADLVASYFGRSRSVMVQNQESQTWTTHVSSGFFGWSGNVMNQFRYELGQTIFEDPATQHPQEEKMDGRPVDLDVDDRLSGRVTPDFRELSGRDTFDELPVQSDFNRLASPLTRNPSTSTLKSTPSTYEQPLSFLAAPPGPVGLLGYIGYDILTETLPNAPDRTAHVEGGRPDAQVAFCNTVLTYDHLSDRWWITGLIRLDAGDEMSKVEELLGHSIGMTEEEWVNKTTQIQRTVFDQKQCEATAPILQEPLKFKPAFEHEEYLNLIHKAQDQIRAGESYEICLTMPFTTTMKRVLPPDQTQKSWVSDQNYLLYLGLRKKNAAPYGAYIRFLPFDVCILASSPERFIKVSRMGQVEMKPIKGTAKRNLTCQTLDNEVARTLRDDVKERAENLMITDLVRHDLVSICEAGSVEVSHLMKIETMATVHQLVSTVVGRLKEGVGSVEAIQQTFPPGSMTGAPKLRSVQILNELETKQGRGVYSGCLGYWGVDGSSDFSVIIRTAIIRGNEVTLGGGGAITILSEAEQEWQEVQTKVAAVTAALNTVT